MFRQGIVVDTHPEDHSVDLVMMDDGSRLIGVQVTSQNGSTRSGSVDMPSVPEKKDKWDITQRSEQDQIALVGFVRGYPVVFGYLFPQVSQMTFADKKRRMDRHQSDVYTTVDGDGNMEIHHPSGAYIRIAENPDHEDLENKNYDESFKLDRNKSKRVSMRLAMGDKASITISPDGDITIGGKSVNISSATGDVTVNGISLVHHRHGGVAPGGGSTSEPMGPVS